jgi:hypothetical protein
VHIDADISDSVGVERRKMLRAERCGVGRMIERCARSSRATSAR